jgi:hypothetical protein
LPAGLEAENALYYSAPKFLAGRDDFLDGLASFALWGRLIEAAEKVRKQRLGRR